MKTFILLLILNQPDGSAVELQWKRGLAWEECDALQRDIWDTPQAVAFYDAQGPVPVLDAACVTPAQLQLSQLPAPN